MADDISPVERLKNMAEDLVALREMMDFITHPLVVPLMNAAFDNELEKTRDLARAMGLEEEFEQALSKTPIMH
jgi:hypothetical protein